MNLWESLCYLFGEESVKSWMRTSPERFELVVVNYVAITLMGKKKLEQIELEVLNVRNGWTEKFEKAKQRRLKSEQRRSSSKSKTDI